MFFFFFFSSRRRHTRFDCDWSSDVCSSDLGHEPRGPSLQRGRGPRLHPPSEPHPGDRSRAPNRPDRKSTRLNSSHSQISYAVFCLKKKKKNKKKITKKRSTDKEITDNTTDR